ncbi:hypothetical protein IP92_04669 [Pseudoduganella flava]|uniref:Type II secretion system protein GspC N-terminal domain-containing protein n=1 Tax=Pseudoduganella flava TaxID=871742 RepID=A0A562PIV5_9BURK|nr:hypothetical protein [Pseudoduganella flava]QGZ42754.1 hypothetical protein GO485_29430 [Pseudoduganella flava]TWI44150.1 hypothetical protein IP92_04669 [Pseudoduganella flava]
MRIPALVACVAAAVALPAAAQDPLAFGRLFTTSAERAQLDQQRYSGAPVPNGAAAAPPAAATATAPAAAPPPAPPPAPVRLSGVVRRSNGSATVWLDGEARDTRLGRYRAGAPVPVDVAGRRLLMKPGQSYSPDDGTISDLR